MNERLLKLVGLIDNYEWHITKLILKTFEINYMDKCKNILKVSTFYVKEINILPVKQTVKLNVFA